MKHYDYIIAGAGCAGLSLLVRLVSSGQFLDKKILLVDRKQKNKNDRTWCFWETQDDIFEPIVYKRWQQFAMHTQKQSLLFDIAPYYYKLIRAIDFYSYCLDFIRKGQIDIQYGEVETIVNDGDSALLTISGNTIAADYVFSSILPGNFTIQKGRHYLLQHFTGWFIKSQYPCFDPGAATFMDFRVTQKYGHCFIYLLPFNQNEALVECTFFSPCTVDRTIYHNILTDYLDQFYYNVPFEIVEEETGIIPMTNHNFQQYDGRIIYIGTAGGFTKASSGYTFKSIQRHTQMMVKNLIQKGHPYVNTLQPARFRFYDTIMLNVLQQSGVDAGSIFGQLFQKNQSQHVLSFLDNTSTLQQEMNIISSLPKKPFLKAAIQELRNKYLY